MNNKDTSASNKTVIEFTVRQVIGSNQAGNILAGPFTDELKAQEQQKHFTNSGVFQETWLN